MIYKPDTTKKSHRLVNAPPGKTHNSILVDSFLSSTKMFLKELKVPVVTPTVDGIGFSSTINLPIL